MSEFEFVTSVPVRYRDLDPLNHVNHAVYASYLEEARVEYMRELFDTPGGDGEFVLAHLEVDYERSVTLSDEPAVAIRVSDMGTSSLTFDYEIRTDGTVAATADTTLVHMGEDGTPSPLPDEWRESVRQFEPALE